MDKHPQSSVHEGDDETPGRHTLMCSATGTRTGVLDSGCLIQQEEMDEDLRELLLMCDDSDEERKVKESYTPRYGHMMYIMEPEEGHKQKRKVNHKISWTSKMHVVGPEGHEPKRKKITSYFLLDSLCYEDLAPNSDDRLWIYGETSDEGVKFKVSLCIKKWPYFSRLLFKRDDAECASPATSDVPAFMEMSIEVISFCYNAILLHTIINRLGIPFCHDYFLLKNDPPSPELYRLPKMPGDSENMIGIMCRGGHYLVAMLKEYLPSKTEVFIPNRAAHIRKGVKGPFICTFSTLTCKWNNELLPPIPIDWNLWDSHMVLACDNKFWWVDLRYGLLSWDPCEEQLSFDFTQFPADSRKEKFDTEDQVLQHRSVKVSDRKLRYVHISSGIKRLVVVTRIIKARLRPVMIM